MIYTKNLPQVKICLEQKEFNILLELISNGINDENKIIKDKSIMIKDKLLKYSTPSKVNENKMEIKSLFYINEITDILEVIIMTSKISVTENYYNKLEKLQWNN